MKGVCSWRADKRDRKMIKNCQTGTEITYIHCAYKGIRLSVCLIEEEEEPEGEEGWDSC